MKRPTKILIWVLAIVILIGILLFWRNYQAVGSVSIQTDKSEYQGGDILKVKIKNNFRKSISFSSCYPYYLERKNENWESYNYGDCQKDNENWYYIDPQKERAFEINLSNVSGGLHRLVIPICIGCKDKEPFREDKRFYSNEFLVKEIK